MKAVAWLTGVLGLLGSAGYLFVYLARWQWNRALFSAAALIALLVALSSAYLVRRLGQLEERLEELSPRTSDPFLRELEATRPRRDHFAWLDDLDGGTHVFITMLLGGGVLVSGVAWLVGRIAEGTTTSHAEGRLAARLGPLAFPDAGLRPPSTLRDDDAGLLLRGPSALREGGS